MRKILLPLMLICLFSAIFINKMDASDKNKKMSFTQAREIKSFSSIRVGSVFNVYVSQGSSSRLEIKSTHDLLNRIRTEVVNGELIIEFKDNEKRGYVYSNLQIDIYVSSNQLRKIKASGSSDVYSCGLLNAENMDISASGASDVKLDLEVRNSLKCTASGSSDIILSGSADCADIVASGASDVDLKKLFVKDVKAVSSGSSDVNLNVSESLSVSASGASDVSYTGNPKIINKSSSGSSDITRRR